MQTPLELLQQFRQRLYQTFRQRADATMDLIDGLAHSDQVESPVAVSQVPSFRRRFASIYDALHCTQPDEAALRRLLFESVPPDSQTLAGYEVYAVDVTPQPHPAADTLADRTYVCVGEDQPAVAGHQYSLLVRLVHAGTSWVAPLDVRRVPSTSNGNAVGGEQVQALDEQSAQPKVTVADSGYGNQHFLRIFLLLKTLCALVRLRGNLVLYEAGSVRQARGRKRVHGDAFRLAGPRRPPDREETLSLASGRVVIHAWYDLHLKALAVLPGTVLQVELFRADGSRLHKRPWWLFWTGPPSVSLVALYQMYAWRFTIEHTFRFWKQHLGLNAARLVKAEAPEHWVWCGLLAYWQLLLAREVVGGSVPPWQAKPKAVDAWAYTPRQVQKALPGFSVAIGTPAAAPKPAGKGVGRTSGCRPKPRPRYPVILKGKKKGQKAAAADAPPAT
jgi:hypothetical protein